MFEATFAISRLFKRGIWHFRTLGHAADASRLLWLLAALVAATVALPTVYLLLRTLAAGQDAWRLIWRLSTLETLGRTIWLASTVTLASAFIAVPIAWLTARTDLRLRRFWVVVTALPLVVPSYVGAYLMVSALGPRGLLQQRLEGLFGIERLPEIYGFPGALLALTLMSFPYTLLNVRAALSHLDPSMEEAARSLGHGGLSTFFKIILPQLRPALASGSLLVALYTLRDFGAVSIMRYNTFTRVIYIQYRSSFDRTVASVFALALVALTMVILVLEMRSRNRAQYHRSAPGAARRHKLVRLGRWQWPALAFCGVITGLALVLPTSVLLYWLVRGLQAGERLAPLWPMVVNSIVVSGLAAGVAMVAAVPVAVLNVRRAGRLSDLLVRVVYSGFALPGIVLALALVFFGVNYARSFYQTMPILILAYVILFLPQSVGALRTSLLHVHPGLEEAARSLGRRPLNVFRTIVFPLVRPGVMTAVALVFLTTMKELPATLILSPLGFTTLATTVWSAVSEAYFAQAAAPALLLILVSSIPMAFFVIGERKSTT